MWKGDEWSRATKDDIRGWLRYGIQKGATHVIVVCDTFDWTDYPVYIMPGMSIEKRLKNYNVDKNMQQVMEVYNLALSLDPQLDEHRAWHI